MDDLIDQENDETQKGSSDWYASEKKNVGTNGAQQKRVQIDGRQKKKKNELKAQNACRRTTNYFFSYYKSVLMVRGKGGGAGEKSSGQFWFVKIGRRLETSFKTTTDGFSMRRTGYTDLRTILFFFCNYGIIIVISKR